MAETTSGYLNSLLDKYTPSTSYFDKARGHKSSISARLDKWLGVKEMFETGSLRHGTGVWCHSDVDYIVSLKGARPTPTTALNNVREALKDKFPNTTIRVARPAVVCGFSSGDETVEVVPAYDATGGGYWIPDPADLSGWMKSYPKNHNTWVNKVNQKHFGGAKKLARLAKTWKYKRLVPVSSCYLEMRAAKYADNETNWDLPIEIYRYFKHIKEQELAAMNDPTRLGCRFTACSSTSNKADALSKLDTALGRAEKAHAAYMRDDHAAAVTQWKRVFNQ